MICYIDVFSDVATNSPVGAVLTALRAVQSSEKHPAGIPNQCQHDILFMLLHVA